MPGGRNSGAVYNLYKVKYKKHKKKPPTTTTAGQTNGSGCASPKPLGPPQTPSPPNGSSANTSTHIGQTMLSTAVSPPSSKGEIEWTGTSPVQSPTIVVVNTSPQPPTPEEALRLIRELIDCDDFEDVATLNNMQDLLVDNGTTTGAGGQLDGGTSAELPDKLCEIGDNIVYKLVQWTKRLPFYHEIPLAVHTQVSGRPGQRTLEVAGPTAIPTPILAETTAQLPPQAHTNAAGATTGGGGRRRWQHEQWQSRHTQRS
ncbi:hypothetical protein BIW11_00291 [Tropilaelaps mercedesae]|uniref:Uncharacterized protein n=1 Tax=Tropilaelaps mercedesae TaxID=418985 RepID=A0A1V9XYG1_9ACAR|nr:hypothetical protein BIW11_00291 [Tropilaelaps mercedesae]